MLQRHPITASVVAAGQSATRQSRAGLSCLCKALTTKVNLHNRPPLHQQKTPRSDQDGNWGSPASTTYLLARGQSRVRDALAYVRFQTCRAALRLSFVDLLAAPCSACILKTRAHAQQQLHPGLSLGRRRRSAEPSKGSKVDHVKPEQQHQEKNK